MRPLWLAGLGAFLLATVLFVFSANQHLPLSWWPDTLLNDGAIHLKQIIFLYGVLPRAGVALVAGAILGLAGALLQQLLRNPLADPSTLGISAGAQLAIVVATLFFPTLLDGHRTLVALMGAAFAAGIVFSLGWRTAFEPVTMVVSGMLVGVTAAALSAALTLAQSEYLMSLLTWNGGSLSQQDWSVFLSMLIELLIGGTIAAILLRPLLLMGLGDESARSLGISLRGLRIAVATLATAFTALVAAHVGLISFVGLAAAAFLRGFGVRSPAVVVLLSPLAGALFLWLCDGAVQVVAGTMGETFPTGAVTALIGGPVLLWLLPRIRAVQVQARRSAPMQRASLSVGATVMLLFMFLIVALVFCVGSDGHGWRILSTAEVADLAPWRWPRLVASAGAGGLLALTGAVLQRFTGNSMASPEVIGVSGGAGLGFAAALTIVPAADPLLLLGGAGAGGLLTMTILLLFARQRNLPPEKLLLAGIAVGSLSSAVLAALMAAGDQRAWQILAWIGGTASSATPASALLLAGMAIILLVAFMALTRWLTLLPLGSAISIGLGVPIAASRIVILMICALATGAASMLVGPLSFVGLIAPHIAVRAGFTTARDHLVASFLLGALVMAFADLGARMATFPYELPLGLFAALVGAPYLVWLVGRR
jgi:iron complex transport system permease protein